MATITRDTADRLENIIKNLRNLCLEFDCCDDCADYHGEVEYQCENLDDIVEELRQRTMLGIDTERRALCLFCGLPFYHSVGHDCKELTTYYDKTKLR